MENTRVVLSRAKTLFNARCKAENIGLVRQCFKIPAKLQIKNSRFWDSLKHIPTNAFRLYLSVD